MWVVRLSPLLARGDPHSTTEAEDILGQTELLCNEGKKNYIEKRSLNYTKRKLKKGYHNSHIC